MRARKPTLKPSPVAFNAAVAAAGPITVLFLLGHRHGTLRMFEGQAPFDDYARPLRTVGEPFLPRPGALGIIRVVPLVSVPVRSVATVALWACARRPAPQR